MKPVSKSRRRLSGSVSVFGLVREKDMTRICLGCFGPGFAALKRARDEDHSVSCPRTLLAPSWQKSRDVHTETGSTFCFAHSPVQTTTTTTTTTTTSHPLKVWKWWWDDVTAHNGNYKRCVRCTTCRFQLQLLLPLTFRYTTKIFLGRTFVLYY